jgi:tetratricopeptide (TPR) repeat protein
MLSLSRLPFAVVSACVLVLAVAGATGAGPAPAQQQAGAPAQPDESARKEARRKAAEAAKLLERGDWKQARQLAREAVEADPTSPQTHYVLGMSYEAAGELEAAEAEYKKMGPFAPEPLLELSLARLYLRQGRLEEAEQQSRRAVEKNRWVPQPFLSLGTVAMRKKDYSAAIDAFSKAVDVAPGDWNARLSLADAYRNADHWDEALTEYSEALARKPDLIEALLGKAQTWERMGRAAEAIAGYERTLEAAPGLAAAQFRLARLYATAADPALRKPHRALELAKAAAETTEWKNREVLEALARAWDTAGDAAQAQQTRDKIKQLPAPSPRDAEKRR